MTNDHPVSFKMDEKRFESSAKMPLGEYTNDKISFREAFTNTLSDVIVIIFIGAEKMGHTSHISIDAKYSLFILVLIYSWCLSIFFSTNTP